MGTVTQIGGGHSKKQAGHKGGTLLGNTAVSVPTNNERKSWGPCALCGRHGKNRKFKHATGGRQYARTPPAKRILSNSGDSRSKPAVAKPTAVTI